MSQAIESILHEDRKISVSDSFRSSAKISKKEEFEKLYRESIDSPEEFWARQAGELHWFKKWDKVLEWKLPFAKWFLGGKTNISYNCLDRQLELGRANKTALLFESEKGEVKKLSYKELHREVCLLANALKSKGVGLGDRVAIYMPMIPEASIAMLACARIGAVHSVVFGGFSSNALSERINDAQAKAVITADGGWRKGSILELKSAVDEALNTCASVETVFVYQWAKNKVTMKAGRDCWVHELVKDVSADCEATPVDSEHPLFILYTSGSTGKPKGVLHTTGGYMVYTYLTSQYVFDLKDDDLYWCSADIGWVTGHSYVVYGPLANGASVFVYEGAPTYPEPDRFWDLIEKHKVTIFYTAPTAIRAFMKCGDDWVKKHDLSSLRLLGTVGEPINPEAWMWYRKLIGQERCPIVDTWWQTETGGIMITTLPGVHETKPGSAGVPMFGIDAAIVDQEGNEVGVDQGGYLVIKKPWPAMMRTIYGDDTRYKEQYWSQVPNVYFAGDGARKDSDGYFWIMGRIDDVVNVSGHRLGTMEIESALVSHHNVAEAAVVGIPDELKGEAIVAFVTLEQGVSETDELNSELCKHVAKEIGSIARPSKIRFTDALPKTRSGKIMRRLLRSIASGDDKEQDISTLEDQSLLEKLRVND